MQGNGWKEYHVLEAREKLQRIPEKHQATAVAMTTELAIPPKTAITMLVNIAAMTASYRNETFAMYLSDARRKVSLAKSRIAALPPPPDDRVMGLEAALPLLKQALKFLKRLPGFTTDHHTANLQRILDLVKAELAVLRKEHRQMRKEELHSQLQHLDAACKQEGNEVLKPHADAIRDTRDRFAERDSAVGPEDLI